MSECSVDGCNVRHYARGFCEKHYQRWQKYGDPLGGDRNHGTPQERFKRRFVAGKRNECWLWTGARDAADRYGRFQIGGKGSPYWGAHRFSYEMHKGPIPEGMVVMHSCDTPLCVNPAHLRIGTYQENTADMLAKDRHARQAPVGTDNGKAVLTPALVRYIRKHPEKSHAALAREIGCGTSTIRGVRSGRVWSHIK